MSEYPENRAQTAKRHISNLYNLYSGATLLKRFGVEDSPLSLYRKVFSPLFLAAGALIGSSALYDGRPLLGAAALTITWAIAGAAMNGCALIEVGNDRTLKKIDRWTSRNNNSGPGQQP